jgi:hypothetical protein
MKILLALAIAAFVGVLIGLRRGKPNWALLGVTAIGASVVCFVGTAAAQPRTQCGGTICGPGGSQLVGFAAIVLGGLVAAAAAVAALIAAVRTLDGGMRAVGAVPAIVFVGLLGSGIAGAVGDDFSRRASERVARSFFAAARAGDAHGACDFAADEVRNDGALRSCGAVVGRVQRAIPAELHVVSASRVGGTWVVYFAKGRPTVVADVADGRVVLAHAG